MKICLAFNAPEGSNISEVLTTINNEMEKLFEQELKLLNTSRGTFSTEVIYEVNVPYEDSEKLLEKFFLDLNDLFEKFAEYSPRFVKDIAKGGDIR